MAAAQKELCFCCISKTGTEDSHQHNNFGGSEQINKGFPTMILL